MRKFVMAATIAETPPQNTGAIIIGRSELVIPLSSALPKENATFSTENRNEIAAPTINTCQNFTRPDSGEISRFNITRTKKSRATFKINPKPIIKIIVARTAPKTYAIIAAAPIGVWIKPYTVVMLIRTASTAATIALEIVTSDHFHRGSKTFPLNS